MKLVILSIALAVGLATANLASAVNVGPHAAPAVSEADGLWARGTVVRVSADSGKITLKHGPIKTLDMPGMTMVFTLGDPSWAGSLKPGDKILFSVERLNGGFTVTQVGLLL